MNETSGSVTLVSGANGALGSAVVERMAESGAVIALERQHDGKPELERLGPNVLRLRASSNDAPQLAASLARAEAELGPLTGAVLSAGTWRGGHRFHEPAAADDYRAVMSANLESAQLTLRALLPGLVARKRGSVVLVGSRAGARPYLAMGDAAYATSKAALMALAQAVAAEVVSAGVRVNVVLPSTIDTPANRKAMPSADTSRWVSTDSLCGVIAFLLSEQARDVSGAAVPVYGRDGV